MYRLVQKIHQFLILEMIMKKRFIVDTFENENDHHIFKNKETQVLDDISVETEPPKNVQKNQRPTKRKSLEQKKLEQA